MNQETLKAITELSNKLGTTAEYPWSVLVKQAQISGFTSLFEICVTLLVIYFLYALIKKKTAPGEIEKSDVGSSTYWFLFSIACSVVFIVVCLSVANAVTAFVNPEYWALSAVISSH